MVNHRISPDKTYPNNNILLDRSRMSIAAILVVETISTSGLVGQKLTCLQEIFGQSMLDRTIRGLRQGGVKAITVVAPDNSFFAHKNSSDSVTRLKLVPPQISLWSAAECVLREYVRRGVEHILLSNTAAYAELDLTGIVRFNREKNQPLTSVVDSRGTLGIWYLAAKEIERVKRMGLEALIAGASASNLVPYFLRSYSNRLESAYDMRRLIEDAFLSRCAIRPCGREVKPGVWFDDGARIHRRARVVAPVYLGRGTTIGSDTLIAEFSNIERDCEVNNAAIIKAASILPETYIGRGLRVTSAVVDGNKYLHLGSNTVTQIGDPRIVRRRVPVGPNHSLESRSRENSLAQRLLATA